MLNPQWNAAQVEGLVHAAITRLMQTQQLPPRALRGDDKLNATLGLRSLDLAELVFELESTIGADPFEQLVPITSVRTVDDLVGAYRRLFDAGDAGDARADDADGLAAARRAGALRRDKRESW